MLMQNFQSAADLGITEPQKDALVKTLVLLETGKLEYSKAFDFEYDVVPNPEFSGKFNMRYWTAPSSCGTIACLAGTTELISGVSFAYSHHNGLRALFQPAGMWSDDWTNITTAQAATALRSYLTTGDAKWEEAVA